MIAWFICDFRLEPDPMWKANRVCLIFDFDGDIKRDGGSYDFIELYDGRALVKVSASDETLQKIEQTEGSTRLRMNENGLRGLAARNPRKPMGIENGRVVFGAEISRGVRNFDWLDGKVK